MTNRNTKTGAASLLALGALGVVFGDIGTSPLYTLQAAFMATDHQVPITSRNILGVVSMIIWALLISVTIKYITYILRANNHGEGGILALVSLIRNHHFPTRRKAVLVALGIAGVSLFYGDSIITPAISVLSAVEGVKVVNPSLHDLILPATVIIIIGLFWLQHYGTGLIGRFFGPIMFLWFIAIGTGGLVQVVHDPHVLNALSPVAAWDFIHVDPLLAFLSLTVVVLAITGAEALYADLGHFGHGAIVRAWLVIVLPALLLSYMGQGAYLLTHVTSDSFNLVALYPHILQVPFIILATVATLIASEAVIAGAFSLTRQAIQLNLLPKMRIRYTSLTSGRIYLPLINLLMCICVTALVIIFRSSGKLAGAYGIAVSGAVAVDTILYLALSTRGKRSNLLKFPIFVLLVAPIDLLFFSSNLTKIIHGGIYPIVIGVVVFIVITTWAKGEEILVAERQRVEGSLENFAHMLHESRNKIRRVPGAAVFLGHHEGFAPLALHATVEKMHELPEKAIVLTIQHTNEAHVPNSLRASYNDLTYSRDGLSNVILSYGFHDKIHIPSALRAARSLSDELQFDPASIAYVISSARISITKRHHMARWRKHLYVAMARNASATWDYYSLPTKQVEEIDTYLEL